MVESRLWSSVGQSVQCYFIDEWKVDRNIASRQQTTQGLITTHEPSNHNQYSYVFTVNGKNFTGWESPRSEELDVGKRVVVTTAPKTQTRTP